MLTATSQRAAEAFTVSPFASDAPNEAAYLVVRDSRTAQRLGPAAALALVAPQTPRHTGITPSSIAAFERPSSKKAGPATSCSRDSITNTYESRIEPIFYAKGYADMIPRIRALAENPDVPAVTRAPMMQVLENHQRYLSTRKHIEDYLDQVDRHIEVHDSMESLAEELDMKVAGISDYPDWRRENDRLIAAGEAILSDMETHGPHLDNILIGETRMKWALLNMSRAIHRDDEAISEEVIAAEKLLAQPETPEEREQRADLEILKFRRLQSAVDDAATQEEREAALKEFDDYVERHSDSPGEEEHEGRSISRSWSIRL